MFPSIVLRLAGRYAVRRLLHSVLFVLGVAVGVAVVVAIDLANASASRAFALSSASVRGAATHTISGGPNGLDAALYRQLRLEMGVRPSAPVVEGYARASEVGNQPLRVFGVDAFAEGPFRDYLDDVQLAGATADAFGAINRLVAEPNTVVVSRSLADRWSLAVGDTLTLRPSGTPVAVTIVGVLAPADDASAAALDDLLLTDIATAQGVFALGDRLTRIDLILPADADTSAIAALLPPDAALATADEQGGTLDQLTAAFALNLQALSLLALVVGAFLIYNTVAFTVVQRRPAIGTLRALGATRPQVFGLILAEALLLGVLGTALGLGLGILFGRGAVGLVSQTISSLYFTVNVTRLALPPDVLLKAAALGLSASVLAALWPAYDVTRTPPLGVQRRSQDEARARAALPWLAVAGALLVLLGVGLLALPTSSIVVAFAALFAIVLGCALFAPGLLLAATLLATPVFGALFGVVGRMAPRAVGRALSRTAVAVAALTVAVSVIVGVSTMVASFRSSVASWLESTLGADVYISPPTLTATRANAALSADVLTTVAAVPGVARASASRQVNVAAPGFPELPLVNMNAVDFDIAGADRPFAWLAVPDHQAALADGALIVSEPFAFRRGITPQNATLTLTTDAGPVTFPVAGVFYDYSTDQGTVLMDRAVYRRHWDDDGLSAVAAFLTTDAALPGVVAALRAALADIDVTVTSNRDLRASVFAVFDQAFQITVALRLLATLVAFIGILSALLALQLETTRQAGLLRAVGMTPAMLGRYTLLQTTLMGAVAGLLALPVGLALAAVLIYVINVRSFGWSMAFIVPPGQLFAAFAVAVVAAVLAGLYPAYRLGRMPTAAALRAD